MANLIVLSLPFFAQIEKKLRIAQFKDPSILLRPSFNALKLSSLALSFSLDGKFSNKSLLTLSVM
jgi:hypothetical protein